MGKFAERVKAFFQKSLDTEEKDEKKGEEEEEAVETEIEEQSGEGTEGEEVKKSNLTDATDILNALVDELKEVNKSLATLSSRQDGIEKSQVDVGEAIVGVAELVSKIANTPIPPKSTMTKGGLGSEAGTGNDSLTIPEFQQAQKALTKACGEKKITIHEATMLESEMQKAMQIAGYQMRLEDRALMSQILKSA